MKKEPVRITQAALLRKASLRIRSGNLKRYPVSKNYLIEASESLTDFYIRKACLTIDDLRKQGITTPSRGELAAYLNDKRRLYQNEIWEPVKRYLYFNRENE